MLLSGLHYQKKENQPKDYFLEFDMSHAYNKLVIMSTSIKIKDHLISNGNINHSTFLEIVGI